MTTRIVTMGQFAKVLNYPFKLSSSNDLCTANIPQSKDFSHNNQTITILHSCVHAVLNVSMLLCCSKPLRVVVLCLVLTVPVVLCYQQLHRLPSQLAAASGLSVPAVPGPLGSVLEWVHPILWLSSSTCWWMKYWRAQLKSNSDLSELCQQLWV